MEERFGGRRIMRSLDCPRRVSGKRASRGTRSCYGLPEVLPPPLFPVTTANALHELVRRESDAIRGSLTRVVKKEIKIPKPPELLSKFSLRVTPHPMCKPYSPGGSQKKSSQVTMQRPRTSEGSLFSSDAGHFPPSRESKKASILELKREPSKFQPEGPKAQGARSKVLSQLEQYRLNSQARIQLKHRAEAYVLDRQEKQRSKMKMI